MSGSDRALLELAGRLTVRDRWLLEMLLEHRVLTRHQLTRLAFTGERMTRMRMATLYQLQAVDRVRLGYGMRSSPNHYVLGNAGAAILAARRAISVAELGYRRDKLLAWATSPRLGHLLGVNTVFSAWVHDTRSRPEEQGLTVWWSERRATAVWGRWIRPDGYGTWQTARRRLDFYLEFDSGSESLSQVARKIPGYTRLAASSGLTSPVLIWVPSARRERELRVRLAASPAGVMIATAAPLPAPASPHGAPSPVPAPGDLAPARHVWLPLHASTRTDLDGLTDRYGTLITPRSPLDDTPEPGEEEETNPAPSPRPPQLLFGGGSPLEPQ
ncbi:replication-relaxation family protein [Parafrankia elaeagni]|uniref:replication-relaxation family protein n=1 Tax=Parafrankia elaeagni TaxID=222534 RepID=UPI000372512A|nr:replication-relaxation family protein [Parafrankia elaeagni]